MILTIEPWYTLHEFCSMSAYCCRIWFVSQPHVSRNKAGTYSVTCLNADNLPSFMSHSDSGIWLWSFDMTLETLHLFVVTAVVKTTPFKSQVISFIWVCQNYTAVHIASLVKDLLRATIPVSQSTVTGIRTAAFGFAWQRHKASRPDSYSSSAHTER